MRPKTVPTITNIFLAAFLVGCGSASPAPGQPPNSDAIVQCTSSSDPHELSPVLGVNWVRSNEDDAGDTLAYRPEEYAFPPSRGRGGFRAAASGEFAAFQIAPTDGILEVSGCWEQVENTAALRVTLNNGQRYTLQIVEIQDTPVLLKVLSVFDE